MMWPLYVIIGFTILAFVTLCGTAWSDATAEQKRLEYLNTFTSEELEETQRILNNHQWVEMTSSETYYHDDLCGPNVKSEAVDLAAPYAYDFAISNGYNPDLIYKIYRKHNLAHSKYLYRNTTYSTHVIEARYTLSGRKLADPPERWTSIDKIYYKVGFYILK